MVEVRHLGLPVAPSLVEVACEVVVVVLSVHVSARKAANDGPPLASVGDW